MGIIINKCIIVFKYIRDGPVEKDGERREGQKKIDAGIFLGENLLQDFFFPETFFFTDTTCFFRKIHILDNIEMNIFA